MSQPENLYTKRFTNKGLPAYVATWALLGISGCALIGPYQGQTENRIARGYDSIPAIAPLDSTTVFLDSGIVSFNFNQADTLEYDATSDHSLGGLGPDFTESILKWKTTPLSDGRIIVQRLPATNPPDTLPPPPSMFRKDSLFMQKELSGSLYGVPDVSSFSGIYPETSTVDKGVFVTGDGNRMLVITRQEYRDFRIYLQPYGLVYCRLNKGSGMDSDLNEFWIKKYNGVTVDRKKIFGMAKGLIAAYQVKTGKIPATP